MNELSEPMSGLVPLLVALACGLIIGFERGWHQRQEGGEDRPDAGPAGIRTFSLTALLGGIATLFDTAGHPWLLPALLLVLGALLVTSYKTQQRRNEDAGLTTEVALLIAFSLGALAAGGQMLLAAAIAVVTALLLGFKEEIHTTLGRLQRHELHASLQLLLIAVVILPLLPDRPMGPWDAINPRALGLLVMLIAGIGFAGYFAVRIMGPRAGLLLTALFGGLTSSTAVTLGFSRLAKRAPARADLLGAGIALACGTVGPRLLLEVGVVNRSLVMPLLPGALALALIPLLAAFWIARRAGEEPDAPSGAERVIHLENPLELRQALLFGLVLGLIFLLAEASRDLLGDQGLYALAVVSGVADVDAIALAMARQARGDLADDVAVRAILIAAMSNTAVKAGLAALFGGMVLARWASSILVVTLLATGLALVFV
jgi:uncharacterized membrane protein (DUF4010 family)